MRTGTPGTGLDIGTDGVEQANTATFSFFALSPIFVAPVEVSLTVDDANIVEGQDAVFTLTADPAPGIPITVNVDVSQAGLYLRRGDAGARTVEIGTGGTAALRIPTDDDSIDERDGRVIVNLLAGDGYTRSTTAPSGTVLVADNEMAVVDSDVPTLVSSLNQTDGSGRSLTEDQAQAFTTGPSREGYLLREVDVQFDRRDAATAAVLTVNFARGDGTPGAAFATLSASGLASADPSFHRVTFIAAGQGVRLDPKETYFVVLDSTSRQSGSIVLYTTSDAEDAGGAGDFSIADNSLRQGGPGPRRHPALPRPVPGAGLLRARQRPREHRHRRTGRRARLLDGGRQDRERLPRPLRRRMGQPGPLRPRGRDAAGYSLRRLPSRLDRDGFQRRRHAGRLARRSLPGRTRRNL